MLPRSHSTLALAAALALAGGARPALASGGAPEGVPRSSPARSAYDQAQEAIQAKDWPGAVKLLQQAALREPKNPDVYNLLGFAERNQGHLDDAFAHYEKALALDPRHRGAHEYVGEAYLMAGNLPKAEEHLAALRAICGGSCEEYEDLEKAVETYRRAHPAAVR